MKQIAILGSTGSIGTQTLDVVRQHPSEFSVYALSAHRSLDLLIQQALDRLVKGRTTFAIAHRLSTLRHADRIIVLSEKGVAEVGTHDSLLEKKGIYYGLINAQSKLHRIKDDNED